MLENIFDNALRFSADKIVLTIGETKDYLSFAIQLSICKILCEKSGVFCIWKTIPITEQSLQ